MKMLTVVAALCLAASAHAEDFTEVARTAEGDVILYYDVDSFADQRVSDVAFLTGIFRMTEGSEANTTLAFVKRKECDDRTGELTFKVRTDDGAGWEDSSIKPTAWRLDGTTFIDRVARTLCAKFKGRL